jgi:hypothetical protein
MTRTRIKSAAMLTRALTLTLGFVTLQPAFAHNAQSLRETSMRPQAAMLTWHRHYARDRRSSTPGYAGPVPAATATYAGSGPLFVPGRGIVGESCDLPTSACPNDERVTG